MAAGGQVGRACGQVVLPPGGELARACFRACVGSRVRSRGHPGRQPFRRQAELVLVDQPVERFAVAHVRLVLAGRLRFHGRPRELLEPAQLEPPPQST